MNIKLSDEFKTILSDARDEAMRTGHYGIEADHLMLAILRRRGCEACRFLSGRRLDTERLKTEIDAALFRENAIPYYDGDRVRMKHSAAGAVSLAAYEALRAADTEVRSIHLLLALSRSEGSLSREWLSAQDFGYSAMREEMEKTGLLGKSRNRPEIRMEDVVSALGEQLTNLFSAHRDKTDYES